MMDFWTYFYCSLALLTLQVSAFDPRYKRPSSSKLNADDTELEILERYWKKPALDFPRTKAVAEDSFEMEIDEKTAKLNARKSQQQKADSTRWPSKVDNSDALNEISETSSELPHRDAQKSATFEELENQNANIHNPLLNLDHYPIPLKRYTFVELENMNANHYNPYIN